VELVMNHLEAVSNLKEGETGIVHHFTNDRMASKLLSMGILPGKSLRLVRRIPFGGGIYVKVDDQSIALRDFEAMNIILKMAS
jgi:ferrous iron transport protein A